MNNNRNKITFKKILVNQKLGYNNFNVLILKLIFFKNKKHYFYIFLNKKYFKN